MTNLFFIFHLSIDGQIRISNINFEGEVNIEVDGIWAVTIFYSFGICSAASE